MRAVNADSNGLMVEINPVEGDVVLRGPAGEPLVDLLDPFAHLSRNRRFSLRPDGQALAAYHRLDADRANDIIIWASDGTGVALGTDTLEPGNLFDMLPEVAWSGMALTLPADTDLIPVMPE